MNQKAKKEKELKNDELTMVFELNEQEINSIRARLHGLVVVSSLQ